MRRALLIAMVVAAAAGLGGCNQARTALDTATAPAGVAPRVQAKILMRQVGEPGRAGTTLLKDRSGEALVLIDPGFITTADIASVALGRDAHSGGATLVMNFTAAAAPRIQAATEARIGQRVAVTVGDQVLTAATIMGPFSTSMQVTGLADDAEAKRLYTEITGKAP